MSISRRMLLRSSAAMAGCAVLPFGALLAAPPAPLILSSVPAQLRVTLAGVGAINGVYILPGGAFKSPSFNGYFWGAVLPGTAIGSLTVWCHIVRKGDTGARAIASVSLPSAFPSGWSIITDDLAAAAWDITTVTRIEAIPAGGSARVEGI